MSKAWDNASGMADKHANQGGIFVRLANDGDSIIGAFCGEPFAREVVWNGEQYQAYDEDNPDHASLRASLRVMLNFFVPAEGMMKVIEGGTKWFKDVLKVRKKYGLDKWCFEVERHGEAGSPKTTYSILPEEKLDDEMRARIAAADMHDLQALAEGNQEAGGSDDRPAGKRGGGPIDPRTSGEVVARLKALPRTAVDAFLSSFGVERVRDLKESDLPEAEKQLAKMEAEHGAGKDASIDPFA
jgi:hypothetical protein